GEVACGGMARVTTAAAGSKLGCQGNEASGATLYTLDDWRETQA
ncbi:nicotinamidase/pyrazinamidase, partial [Cronobacter sakazakii]